jgi:hypothetical protein
MRLRGAPCPVSPTGCKGGLLRLTRSQKHSHEYIGCILRRQCAVTSRCTIAMTRRRLATPVTPSDPPRRNRSPALLTTRLSLKSESYFARRSPILSCGALCRARVSSKVRSAIAATHAAELPYLQRRQHIHKRRSFDSTTPIHQAVSATPETPPRSLPHARARTDAAARAAIAAAMGVPYASTRSWLLAYMKSRFFIGSVLALLAAMVAMLAAKVDLQVRTANFGPPPYSTGASLCRFWLRHGLLFLILLRPARFLSGPPPRLAPPRPCSPKPPWKHRSSAAHSQPCSPARHCPVPLPRPPHSPVVLDAHFCGQHRPLFPLDVGSHQILPRLHL